MRSSGLLRCSAPRNDGKDTGSKIGYCFETDEKPEITEDNETGKSGQLFEDFLREQGDYEDTTERAIKRVIAFQLAEAMKEQPISKVAMAKRLNTSRSQLDRLLDPDSGNVTLATLARAAEVVGRSIRLELV